MQVDSSMTPEHSYVSLYIQPQYCVCVLYVRNEGFVMVDFISSSKSQSKKLMLTLVAWWLNAPIYDVAV